MTLISLPPQKFAQSYIALFLAYYTKKTNYKCRVASSVTIFVKLFMKFRPQVISGGGGGGHTDTMKS